MTFLPVSIIAYILNGASILANKFLVTKKIPHPLSFVFYISISSLIILVAIPFTKHPDPYTFFVLSVSTILWTIGAYYLFSALKIGLASRVAPIIGTLQPIFLIVYYYIFTHSLSLNDVWGAMLCTFGLAVLILPYLHHHLENLERRNRTHELIYEIASAFFFAVSYIVLKEAYNHTNFLTGLVWGRLILIPICGFILLLPFLRKLVFASHTDQIDFKSKTGALFIFSQISGGVSQFMITFAITLANPALVNSMQGVQYIFLFIGSLFLSKKFSHVFDEKYSKKIIIQKIFGILLIGLGLFVMAFARTGTKNATLGVTYSPRYAAELGLDPKETFISMLNDLNPKTVRLPVYWDLTEPQKDSFDFSDTDYYVKQLEARHIKYVLVVGLKVPRYPECYIPSWAANLSNNEINQAVSKEVGKIVERYRSSPSLEVWQVENEPLFPFGTCPPIGLARTKEEISLVRFLDPNHPVMITESGEFGLWLTSASSADIVGTTLYRRQLAPYATWFKSPLPPVFYQLKGMIVHLFYPKTKIYVSELQEEPWANMPITQTSLQYQTAAFPLGDLEDNINFSKEAGFDTIYAWGVEWWYYLKAHNHPEYLQKAIMIYNDVH